MTEAPRSPSETERLETLDALGVLYTPAEERFDRITRLAQKMFDVPIALISLVADQCQWFKSRQGLDAPETERRVAFCAHAILQDEPFVIKDSLLDPRFVDNPLVTGEPFVRFYAGIPLAGANGQKIGTLCIIDRHPRAFGPTERDNLVDLARWAENELRVSQFDVVQRAMAEELEQAKRQARIDSLTQTWNRRAFDEILDREWARSRRAKQNFGLILFDIDHFKIVNDTYGHQAGDSVLQEIARRIRSSVRSEDALCRYGGEEFALILSNTTEEALVRCAEKVRKRVVDEPMILGGSPVVVTLSAGVLLADWRQDHPTEWHTEQVDKALYRAKESGRNRCEVQREKGLAPR